ESILYDYFFFFHSAFFFFFFFQAEDGIRDLYVTGVQTCALPICTTRSRTEVAGRLRRSDCQWSPSSNDTWTPRSVPAKRSERRRSEERRVGKECRSGLAAKRYKKRRENMRGTARR